MPLLLVGLRKNTSLFQFHGANCVSTVFGPANKRRNDQMHRRLDVGNGRFEVHYRNRFLSLYVHWKRHHRPRGIWPHALPQVATIPDVNFVVLRSKPILVPPEDTRGKEAVKDTGALKKRKCGDESG
jgi:hypothetical protein